MRSHHYHLLLPIHPPHPLTLQVDQDLCFSLVTSDQSLDLEATSKMEREAMAQGFSMLMATIEAAANV